MEDKRLKTRVERLHQSTSREKQRFSIRKLSVGAASVFLGTTFFLSTQNSTAHADTVNSNPANANQDGNSVKENNAQQVKANADITTITKSDETSNNVQSVEPADADETTRDEQVSPKKEDATVPQTESAHKTESAQTDKDKSNKKVNSEKSTESADTKSNEVTAKMAVENTQIVDGLAKSNPLKEVQQTRELVDNKNISNETQKKTTDLKITAQSLEVNGAELKEAKVATQDEITTQVKFHDTGRENTPDSPTSATTLTEDQLPTVIYKHDKNATVGDLVNYLNEKIKEANEHYTVSPVMQTTDTNLSTADPNWDTNIDPDYETEVRDENGVVEQDSNGKIKTTNLKKLYEEWLKNKNPLSGIAIDTTGLDQTQKLTAQPVTLNIKHDVGYTTGALYKNIYRKINYIRYEMTGDLKPEYDSVKQYGKATLAKMANFMSPNKIVTASDGKSHNVIAYYQWQNRSYDMLTGLPNTSFNDISGTTNTPVVFDEKPTLQGTDGWVTFDDDVPATNTGWLDGNYRLRSGQFQYNDNGKTISEPNIPEITKIYYHAQPIDFTFEDVSESNFKQDLSNNNYTATQELSWNNDTDDYQTYTNGKVTNPAKYEVRDATNSNGQSLDQIIENLKKQGYTLVSIAQNADNTGVVTANEMALGTNLKDAKNIELDYNKDKVVKANKIQDIHFTIQLKRSGATKESEKKTINRIVHFKTDISHQTLKDDTSTEEVTFSRSWYTDADGNIVNVAKDSNGNPISFVANDGKTYYVIDSDDTTEATKGDWTLEKGTDTFKEVNVPEITDGKLPGDWIRVGAERNSEFGPETENDVVLSDSNLARYKNGQNQEYTIYYAQKADEHQDKNTVSRVVNFVTENEYGNKTLLDSTNESVTYSRHYFTALDKDGKTIFVNAKKLADGTLVVDYSNTNAPVTDKWNQEGDGNFVRVDVPEITNGKLSGDWIRTRATRNNDNGPEVDGAVVPVDSITADNIKNGANQEYTIYYAQKANQETEEKTAKRTIHFVGDEGLDKETKDMPELTNDKYQNISLEGTYYVSSADGKRVAVKTIQVDGKDVVIVDNSEGATPAETWTIKSVQDVDSNDNGTYDFNEVNDPATINVNSAWSQDHDNVATGDWYHTSGKAEVVTVDPNSKDWKETLDDQYLVYKQKAAYNIHYVDVTGLDKSSYDPSLDTPERDLGHTVTGIGNDTDGHVYYVGDTPDATNELWKTYEDEGYVLVQEDPNLGKQTLTANTPDQYVYLVKKAEHHTDTKTVNRVVNFVTEEGHNVLLDPTSESVKFTQDYDYYIGKDGKQVIVTTKKLHGVDVVDKILTGDEANKATAWKADKSNKPFAQVDKPEITDGKIPGDWIRVDATKDEGNGPAISDNIVPEDTITTDKLANAENQVYTIYYVQKSTPNEETVTHVRHINYFDGLTGESLSQIAPSVTQEVSFKRTGVYQNGKLIGYNTTGKTDKYGQLTVDTTDPDKAWVATTNDGKYAEVKSPDLTKNGYKLIPSFKLHEDNQDAAIAPEEVASALHDGKDIDIYYFHNIENVQESADALHTIDYKYANGPHKGETAASDFKQTVTYTRKGTKDLVTGKITWNSDWQASDAFKDVTSPEINNYTVDIEKVDGPTVNTSELTDGKHLEFHDHVLYVTQDTPDPTPTEKKYHWTIEYVDEDGNKLIPDVKDPKDYPTGDTYNGSTSGYEKPTITVDGKTYELVPSKSVNTSGTFTDHDEHTIYVYKLKEDKPVNPTPDVPVTPDNPTPSTPDTPTPEPSNPTPDKPVEPTTPTEPSTPNTPTPSEPSEPTTPTPDTPSESNTPSEPSTPTQDDSTPKPSTPKKTSYRESNPSKFETVSANKKYKEATAALHEDMDNLKNGTNTSYKSSVVPKSDKILPQTGEKSNTASEVAGIMTAALAGLVGFVGADRKKKRR